MPASEQYWRSLPQMHKVFAGSAVLLLGTTLLMMYKDESRSWQNYQRQAEKYRLERIEQERRQFDDSEYREQERQLRARKRELQASWDSRSNETRQLERNLSSLQGRLEILKTESKIRNAERDKARADYDIKVRDEASPQVLSEYLDAFRQAERIAGSTALELQDATRAFQEVKSKLDAERAELDDTRERLNQLTLAETALTEQKNLLAPDNAFVALKRWTKELPIINGFNPHLKILYDWPAGLHQELGMVSVDRVDRCRTCHVNIDDFSVIRQGGEVVGMGPSYSPDEYPQPFCSHPRADVYLTATSPHPVNRFGCTICHAGDGSGTSFQNAEHTPSDPAIAMQWKKDHHWHSNHFWEAPMHPKQFIESSCLKCHHNVVELGINEKYGPTAPKAFKGWEIVRDYGCFGCHEINGYDGIRPIGPDLRLEPNSPAELAAIQDDPNMMPGTMRKVGPSLRYIGSKSSPEFVAYWTEEPKRFRPDTRMPQFFHLSNQHDELAGLLQPVEIAAIAKYLDLKSESFETLRPKDGYEPNPERGADLFAKRGCLACHSKQGEEFAGLDSDFGPDLSRVHEKVMPGEQGFLWMYTWIKEPTKYHQRTKMPDLYLEPYQDTSGVEIDPAADIAAYLLQGGSKDFPELAESKPSLGIISHSISGHDDHGRREKSIGQGIVVDEVVAGSAATRAQQVNGDKKTAFPILKGDCLIAIDGVKVGDSADLAKIESELEIGSTVLLTISRKGQERQLEVEVSSPLDDLVRLYLGKTLDFAALNTALQERRFPVGPDMYEEGRNLADYVKGDDIELAPASYDEEITPEMWEERKLLYIGRRTISRYGCYGCHDIPGFENARPIGTALQDWGVKDTSKLAFEHIHEFLHHHGDFSGNSQPAHSDHHEHGHAALGASISARMEKIVADQRAGGKVDPMDLTEAMLYQSAITHGRPGFLWQKLRQPRSYDYRKTETQGWDERLRMPKFPFSPEEIEAVSTFVLGLVAQPPASEFLFQPDERQEAIFNGERLLAKYNCASCHSLEMGSIEFEYDADILAIKGQEIGEADRKAFDLLAHIKPIGKGKQGATGEVTPDGSTVYRATGFIQGVPDPEEDDPEFRFYSYRFWDGFQLEDGKYIMPSEAAQIGESQVRQFLPGRGGKFGEWLVNRMAPELSKTPGGTDYNAAWQASVPPLTGEGHKVQTPWLYQFLKNPEPLRRSIVLRMPRFNIDDDEAQTLANYFAAKDGVPFPYQSIPPKQLEYQALQAGRYHQEYPGAEDDYLTASWYVLNGPLCRKCHNVGGNVVDDPNQVKGPHLQRIERRLRPEWTQLWIYKPMWVYPYTAMPENFPSDKPADMKELFKGSNPRQAESIIDALFNYTYLMEKFGETTYNPESAVAEPATGGAE